MLLILLMTGMETDLKLVKESSRASISASVCGIIIPFACGFALGEFLPDSMIGDPSKRLITSLFLGTALSIASVKIVATVVREMNFMRRNVGQVILGSAIIDDTHRLDHHRGDLRPGAARHGRSAGASPRA